MYEHVRSGHDLHLSILTDFAHLRIFVNEGRISWVRTVGIFIQH